jgi:hypothetical protein
MSDRYEKNIRKVQDMVDGDYKTKLQVGQYNPTEEKHEVGDKWTDSDGYEWEQKDGYRSKTSKITKGIAESCPECGDFILKKWDKDSFKWNDKCYHCQIEYEARLKTWPIKYWAFRRIKSLKLMDGLDEEMTDQINLMNEAQEENKRKHNDMSVANALANGNVDTSMKMHKNKL